MNDITAPQIRAARALLGISADELATRAAIGIATVRRAEAAESVPSVTKANLAAIRRTLEQAGVLFIDQNGHGPGVRLRDRKE